MPTTITPVVRSDVLAKQPKIEAQLAPLFRTLDTATLQRLTAQIALARSWQAETVKVGPRVLIETPAPMATAVRARFFPGEDRAQLTDCRAEAARLLTAL